MSFSLKLPSLAPNVRHFCIFDSFLLRISKMKKIISLTPLIFIPQANCGQFDHAVGVGLQYGGIIGYQFSYKEAQSNFRISAGLIGASLGYDYYLTDTFSFGATYTASTRDVTSLNFNYTPSGYANSGWVIGVDFAYIEGQRESGSNIFYQREEESKKVMWLSAGYKF